MSNLRNAHVALSILGVKGHITIRFQHGILKRGSSFGAELDSTPKDYPLFRKKKKKKKGVGGWEGRQGSQIGISDLQFIFGLRPGMYMWS